MTGYEPKENMFFTEIEESVREPDKLTKTERFLYGSYAVRAGSSIYFEGHICTDKLLNDGSMHRLRR